MVAVLLGQCEVGVERDGVALTQELAEKSGRFFDEFNWYMRAMKVGRRKGLPY